MTLAPSRRDALILSGKALLGLMAAMPALSGCGDGTLPAAESEPLGLDTDASAPTVIDWNSFVEEVATLAETQFSSNWDQETYVRDLAELMASLDVRDPVLESYFNNYTNAAANFPEITQVYWQESFELSVLEFEPGEIIGLHDHPDMTGVIMCCSGRVEVDNYTLLDERSDNGNYLLRQDSDIVMSAGTIGTLTATNRNIHGLRATEFTQMLDVFTPPYNDYRSYASKWFSKANQPYGNSDDVFEADAY